MRYKQVVTLSSVVVTNAEDEEQAAEQIHGEVHIGEYEREDEPTLIEEIKL